MTDAEAAFVRSIAQAGADPTPRLAFADWLDEHAQLDRAALIRDQVLVASTPADTPERRAAALRASKLLKKHARQWAGPLARHAHDWQFRAGFPDLVALTAAKLRRNAPALFAHSPVRSLTVSLLEGKLESIAAIPPANGVERLALWGARLTPAHLPALASSNNLPRVRVLSLLYNALDDSSLPLLTANPFFSRLERLELGANPLTPAGRERLRETFGHRVTFECEQDPDWLFHLVNDDPFYNGVSPDGVQFVTLDRGDGTHVARFDMAGNLLGVEVVPHGTGDPERTLLEELGARSANVRVKRFRMPNGRGIEPMPAMADWFDDPERGTAEERAFLHEVLDGWLTEAEFAFGNCILNRKGEVTAT